MRISDWSSDVCSSDLQSRNDVMLELDEVARLAGVRRSELTTWIEERWVLPVQEEGRWRFGDRKRVVSGKSVAVRVDIGGRRMIKKKTKQCTDTSEDVSLKNRNTVIAQRTIYNS